MPIEPVIVSGWAKMRSAGVETQKPPLAATLPIDTTIGTPFSL